MANYSRKIDNLKARRHDIFSNKYLLSEGFYSTSYGASTKYALESMKPIDGTYTQNTYKACERVKSQISNGLQNENIDVDFRYQGSVPTNTHIKLYSDIDLLTIHRGFFSLEPPQQPVNPYKGDPVSDLLLMRTHMHSILMHEFPTATIDNSGSKALSISGGSLNRKIDVIPSNWYNSVKYTNTGDDDYRGINILDAKMKQRILNYPFLHIYSINHKDLIVGGNEKRVIRLLKSLKVDSERNINVSSYDIASLVYRMDNDLLSAPDWNKLILLENTNIFLEKVINDSTFRNDLYVANDTRRIFCLDGTSIEEVTKLQIELQELIDEVNSEIKPLFKSFQNFNSYH